MTLIHFTCWNCKSEFWLRTTPGTVCCPNPNCDNIWSPRAADGVMQKGLTEEYRSLVPLD